VLTEAEVVSQNIAFLETFVYVGGKTVKVKETKKKLEMEFEKVDQVGTVFIKFNKIMLFDLVPDLLLLSEGPMQAFSITFESSSPENKSENEIYKGCRIITYKETEMKIQLNFTDPFLVSQEGYDKLKI